LRLGPPGVPLGEHVGQLAQCHRESEEALGRDVLLLIAGLGALVRRKRVQFVLMRPLPQNFGTVTATPSGCYEP
jgi:hypothetical protein